MDQQQFNRKADVVCAFLAGFVLAMVTSIALAEASS